ncbi:MAG: hypothetical protein ACREH9_00160 [Pseudomonadota bacterium]
MIDSTIGRWHWDATRTFPRNCRDFEGDRKVSDRKHLEVERRKILDEALDRGWQDSFPASDPVAVTQPAPSARDKYRP